MNNKIEMIFSIPQLSVLIDNFDDFEIGRVIVALYMKFIGEEKATERAVGDFREDTETVAFEMMWKEIERLNGLEDAACGN